MKEGVDYEIQVIELDSSDSQLPSILKTLDL
jgi:hypothetical protein